MTYFAYNTYHVFLFFFLLLHAFGKIFQNNGMRFRYFFKNYNTLIIYTQNTDLPLYSRHQLYDDQLIRMCFCLVLNCRNMYEFSSLS